MLIHGYARHTCVDSMYIHFVSLQLRNGRSWATPLNTKIIALNIYPAT